MKLPGLYFVALVGIILSFLSAFLYVLDCSWSNAIGVASTIISIILGVVSIVYTYVSGKETMNVLQEMKRQNNSLVDKINYELSRTNFNDKNIEYIKSTIVTEKED